MAQRTNSEKAPRRFWFGPGLLLAISASLFLWRFVPFDEPKPVVEHAAIPAAATTLSAPDPQWVLSRSLELRLNDSQASRLKSMAASWERDTATLRDELQQASKEFSPEASRSDRSGSSIEQIQERTSRVSDLTHQLLVARSAWWGEASSILTANQRLQVEREWSQRFTIGGSRGK